jgi:hypothetical protein
VFSFARAAKGSPLKYLGKSSFSLRCFASDTNSQNKKPVL